MFFHSCVYFSHPYFGSNGAFLKGSMPAQTRAIPPVQGPHRLSKCSSHEGGWLLTRYSWVSSLRAMRTIAIDVFVPTKLTTSATHSGYLTFSLATTLAHAVIHNFFCSDVPATFLNKSMALSGGEKCDSLLLRHTEAVFLLFWTHTNLFWHNLQSLTLIEPI
jgi:hypothetical protein